MTMAATDCSTRAGSTALEVVPEQLIHALAQLPGRVTFEIPVEHSQRARLERLATAYGVAGRATFVPSTGVANNKSAIPSISPHSNLTFARLVESLYHDGDPPAPCSRNDTVLSGHRIGLITNVPAQYRIPLFGRMAERLAIAGADFRVFFLRENTSGRSWITTKDGIAFDYEALPGFEVPIRARRPGIPTSLERRLAAFKPSILLSAGFSPLVSGRAALFGRKRGVSFGLWSGEHSAMATAQSTLRRLQRRRLLASANFGIAYGSAAARYLSALAGELPVVYGRNTSVPTEGTSERPQATDRVEIITVGDLASPRKGVDILVDALALAPALRCRLTIIGGGRLLSALRRRAEGDRRIRFLGSLPPAAVRDAYAVADVFAFPSRADVYGLALVEAMGSGLAVATTPAPGVVADLCVDGHNAMVISGHQPEEWATALTGLVEDGASRESLGEKARLTISRRWTIDHAADGMIAGLRLGAYQGRSVCHMTQLASEPQSTIGARVAAARRNRGMTQRDLAEALGVTSWTIDRIESGGADVGRYLSSIADVTQTSRDWFVGSIEGRARDRTGDATLPHVGGVGKDLVLGSIVLLVTIRFFTEVVPVVPRAANFIDIPIFLVALGVVATQPSVRTGRWYLRDGPLLPPSCFSACSRPS